MPLFIRKFIVDFVETALASLLLLNVAFPNNLNQTQQTLVTVGVAITGALVSAIRRTTPDFLGWLKSKLNVA